MLFIMGSVFAQLRDRTLLAALLFACALLSKETAAAMLPAIVVAGHLQRQRIDFRVIAPYFAVSVAWLLIHPAPRLLPSQASRNETLGAQAVGPLASLLREVLAVLNVPLGPIDRTFLASLAPYVVVAFGILAIGLFMSARGPSSHSRLGRPMILGLIMALPTCLMPGLLPLLWSPYYSCMPALGLALALGVLLARATPIHSSLVIAAYFAMGIASRSVGLEPIVTSELHLHSTAKAISKVEQGFKALRPNLPEKAHVYVSAQVQGPEGVYAHLFRWQPLRVWYREPSLLLLDPNRPKKGPGEDFLFWVTNDYKVFEVDLHTLEPRSSGPSPDLFAYQKTLRTFALGLAALDRTDDAVRILLQMRGRPLAVQVYDRRTAAALLLVAGRRQEGLALLEGVPQFSRVEALDAVFAILHEPSPGIALEAAVMEAFGLSPEDLEANRMLMQAFDQNGFYEAAIRFAHRLNTLAPNDTEASAVLRKWAGRRKPIPITVPTPNNWPD